MDALADGVFEFVGVALGRRDGATGLFDVVPEGPEAGGGAVPVAWPASCVAWTGACAAGGRWRRSPNPGAAVVALEQDQPRRGEHGYGHETDLIRT